ncbi:MAG: hypothetical protein JWO44_2107 [Bacteroidetes bacterium]|nr:hypothetical protein [Bacteroidota bacterium]
MKTNSKKLAIALLSVASLFAACKKDNLRPMNISDKSQLEQPAQRMAVPDQNMFERTLCSHRWLVGNYNDGKIQMRTNHTDMFRDYVFEFNEYHVVIAKGAEKNVVGKWNTITVNGQKKLFLDFGFNPFITLNKEWMLVNYTSTAVNLRNQVQNGTAALDFTAVSDVAK